MSELIAMYNYCCEMAEENSSWFDTEDEKYNLENEYRTLAGYYLREIELMI